MGKGIGLTVITAALALVSACGEQPDQAQRDQAVKQAIEQGMQKERAMMEGMVKGVENVEKNLAEQQDETKK